MSPIRIKVAQGWITIRLTDKGNYTITPTWTSYRRYPKEKINQVWAEVARLSREVPKR